MTIKRNNSGLSGTFGDPEHLARLMQTEPTLDTAAMRSRMMDESTARGLINHLHMPRDYMFRKGQTAIHSVLGNVQSKSGLLTDFIEECIAKRRSAKLNKLAQTLLFRDKILLTGRSPGKSTMFCEATKYLGGYPSSATVILSFPDKKGRPAKKVEIYTGYMSIKKEMDEAMVRWNHSDTGAAYLENIYNYELTRKLTPDSVHQQTPKLLQKMVRRKLY